MARSFCRMNVYQECGDPTGRRTTRDGAKLSSEVPGNQPNNPPATLKRKL